MTTGFSKDQVCVGSNNPMINVTSFEQPLIEEIANLDGFVGDFFNEGLKATEQGVFFHSDSFFFFISKSKPTKIDFILGDLDNLTKVKSRKVGLKNLYNVKEMLLEFCDKNVAPDFRENFLNTVERYYKQATNDLEKMEF